MSLLARITTRLVAIAMLLLAATAAWILLDVRDRLHLEAETAARRIVSSWETWPGLAGSSGVTSPELLFGAETMVSGALVLPGICVVIGSEWAGDKRFCNARDRLSGAAPGWFRDLFERLFDLDTPVVKTATFRGRELGRVTATIDPQSAADRAFEQFRLLSGLAGAIILGMCLMAAWSVQQELRPARSIIRAIRKLEHGDASSRLAEFRTLEFGRIAQAFNDLAERLQKTTAERERLTRRLFQVQEEERSAIARELHDEFGQCLTAIGALAASIETGTPPAHPDLADDARAVARLTQRMQGSVRGVLSQLRAPELVELGLGASLRELVGSWNAHRSETRFLLEIDGDLSDVSSETALGVYRVIQEALTNAARHGRPSEVAVRVERAPGGAILIAVDDDGGGDPAAVEQKPGLGVLGLRERMHALGGRLTFVPAGGGISVRADFPADAPV